MLNLYINMNFSSNQEKYLNPNNTSDPIFPEESAFFNKNTYLGEPILSKKQTSTHYTGHYLKYINKLNELIKSDPKLNKYYNMVKTNYSSEMSNPVLDIKNIMVLIGIKMYKPDTKIYQNASQIYNHELYWKTMIDKTDSENQLVKLKNKFFNSEEEFNNFKKKFIDEGVGHFGSGWLWIYTNPLTNKLDVFTTHDSVVPFDTEEKKIVGVIDLWEHAFYIDYPAEKKKYLEESFKLLKWNNFLLN